MPPPKPAFQHRRHSGVALVMVLLIVVLLSILVVSFFLDVRTETISADSYSERTRARMLADSVQNLAVAQIQKATEGSSRDGRIVAWASQPGMIRTWDDTGTPGEAYKLYSSDQMVIDGSISSDADLLADVPTDWKSRPAEFTDLNSPVLVEDANGTVSRPGDNRGYLAHFPILSGNDLVPGQYAGKSVQTYRTPIEGFGVDSDWSSGGTIAPDNNPVPMPVRWLYVLQDGTLAPAGSGGSVTRATETNPIVGRVAFWTDDDTCKLNINTASEGAYWGRPYTTSKLEKDLSRNIPAQNEFATFPGHPASTSLSPVLGSIFPIPANANGVPDWLTTSTYSRLLPYYNLTPRVSDGGSNGGTRTPGRTQMVIYDADRLYASVDEFLFKARSVGSQREENEPSMDNRFLEQARFFLTAHSRAPEVNLFNLPRISLWPIDPNTQNGKDRLLAFCSTFSGQPFHFQRTVVSGNSPDLSSFRNTSQSSSIDWDKYPRNRQLYNYLQRLTDRAIPGFGGRMSDKYPGNYRNQVLTEMVDYIRSGVNITSTSTTGGDTPYHFVPPPGKTGAGQVVPLTLSSNGSSGNDTRGFGRFITITEAALVLYRVDASNLRAMFVVEPFCPSPGLPPINPNFTIDIDGLDVFKVNGQSLQMPPDARMTCDAFQLSASESLIKAFPGLLPAGGTAYPATRLMFYRRLSDTNVAPRTPDEYPFQSKGNVPLASGTETVSLTGGLVTVRIYGPFDSGTPLQELVFDFRNIEFDPIGKAVRQEPATIPAPEPIDSTSYFPFSTRIPAVRNPTNIKDTLIRKIMKNVGGVSTEIANRRGRGDVVRSMEPNLKAPLWGDQRALALVTQDTTSRRDPLFVRHPFYDWNPGERLLVSKEARTALIYDPMLVDATGIRAYNLRFAESLRSDELVFRGQFGAYASLSGEAEYSNDAGNGRKGTMMTGGSLIALVPGRYSILQRDAIPSVPYGLDGAYIRSRAGDILGYGDWDTGLGTTSDGPYINYPDQGNSNTATGSYELAVGDGRVIVGGYFGRGDWGDETGATFSPNRQIASAVSFGSLATMVDPKAPQDMQSWRTLLFCPNPAAQTTGNIQSTSHASRLAHPGFGNPAGGSNPYPPYSEPPDHAFLDLFTMPIVEGYPISEPMSTAGKVNMNYQIAPFTYIHRSTAIRGVLKNERLTAIPTFAPAEPNDDNAYKSAGINDRQGWTTQIRYGINLDESSGTLRQFEARFEKGDLFRSASEICDLFLVPQQIRTPNYSLTYPSGSNDPTFSGSGEIDFVSNNVAKWWDNFLATGDNLREEPYNRIYPRLTTKSNSYTVHVRVQTLKKSPSTPPGRFVDPSEPGATDSVTGEFRGSFQVERYLDPNALRDSGVDFATASLDDPASRLNRYYKYRTISSKEFKP